MNRTSPHYCRRSVLSLLISALIYAPPGMTAFTPDVIGVVNDETVDGSQRVDERGTTNNTHIINHGQQNVHGGGFNADNRTYLSLYHQHAPELLLSALHHQ